MKTGKKLSAVALSIVLCISMIAPSATAIAISSNTLDYVCSENDLEEYAINIAPTYLKSEVHDESQKAYLSQGYVLAGTEDVNKRLFFAFLDDKCVGELIVTYLNNDYISTFIYHEIPTIDAAKDNNVAFDLYVVDNTLWFESEEEIVHLSGKSMEAVASTFRNSNVGNAEKKAIELSEVSLNSKSAATFSYGSEFGHYLTSSYGKLNVPYVANEMNPDNGKWLCWAASVASIVAYRNDTEALTAGQVYTAMKNKYWLSVLMDYPDSRYVSKALDYYGVSPDKYSKTLSFSEVQAIINEERPIYMSVAPANDKSNGHALVICGYESAQGGYRKLEFVDSNEPNRTATTFFGDDLSNFSYTYYGTTFNSWDGGYY